VDDVENCKSVVKDLVAGHQHALEHHLEEDDLMFKRSTLSPAVCNYTCRSCASPKSVIYSPMYLLFVL
jgi:hypothetical protein